MKQPSTELYIRGLIAQGEHRQQDFKFEIADARKIAKTLSAFANTAGGRLLVGVKDNGRISGIRSEEEVYMLQSAAEMFCTPSPNYELQTHIVEHKQVLVATVHPSTARPICAKDEHGRAWAYVRMADETLLASPVHLQIWKQENNTVDEVTPFTDQEQKLLARLADSPPLALSAICRLSDLSRPATIRLLARLVRYELMHILYTDHCFHFQLK